MKIMEYKFYKFKRDKIKYFKIVLVQISLVIRATTKMNESCINKKNIKAWNYSKVNLIGTLTPFLKYETVIRII